MLDYLKHWVLKRTERELVMASVGLLAVLTLFVLGVLISPAWGQWETQYQTLELRRAEFAKVSRNLSLNDKVVKGNVDLAKVGRQEGSDETTLSEFLKSVEAISSAQKVNLTSMKPMPVEHRGAAILYRTRLVVQGKMQETIHFIDALTRQRDLTGLESVSLQGLQGGEIIESHLSVIMVKRLKEGVKPPKKISRPRASASTEGNLYVR